MGLTPTGDMLPDIKDPEVTNEISIIPRIEITKNLIINCCLLFLSKLILLISNKLSQAYAVIINVGITSHTFRLEGSAASIGIAGISRKLKTNGEICVAEPSAKPEPRI